MRIRSFSLVAVILLSVVCLGCASADSNSSANSARLPFGALDNPPDGANVQGVAQITGWALSEDGVRRVAIYVDRIYFQDAIISGYRDDVVKVYPAFASVKDMRFVAELHAETIAPGKHELSARAISAKGATRDFPAHNITVSR